MFGSPALAPRIRRRLGALGLSMLAAAAPLLAPAAEKPGAPAKPPITTVFTVVDPSYVRTREADGSFTKETFAFGEGSFSGGAVKDGSIDGLPFRHVAEQLAGALASQGYVPATRPDATKLLIVVHWGMTAPFNDGVMKSTTQSLATAMQPRFSSPPPPPTGPGQSSPNDAAAVQSALDSAQNAQIESMLMMQEQMNQMREKANRHNALLLGYAPDMDRLQPMVGGPFAFLRNDLVDEVEDERYFVVLVAFDFQKLWKEKQRQVLWITRLSMRTRGHRFDRDLAAMARAAARHIGQETKTLVRTNRQERIELGTPEVISYEEEKKK